MKSGNKEFLHDKVEYIAENDLWIVLNNDHFDKITKSDIFEFAHKMIEKPKISIKDGTGFFENDPAIGNGIYYDLYTRKTKRASAIRNEIVDFIKKRYGYLRDIDLSFIK